MTLNAIDAFAGAGGWDVACKELGFDPLGIELDEAACATREAADLRTLQADVADLDPKDFAPCDLFVASPPCPTFSSAGKGAGLLLTHVILRCLHELAAGNDTRAERRWDAFQILRPIYEEGEGEKAAKKKREPDLKKAELRARRDADMSLLVVEPLRWVLALEPRFIALEQVPQVLALWSEMAQILGILGYSTWTGIMEAERYGVPQTRERAILIADREASVHLPRPTHQRYVKGEAQRHDVSFDGEVLPWVSMAEALGWDGAMVKTRGESKADGGNEFSADRPSWSLTGKTRSWVRLRSGQSVDGGERAERDATEPAMTITSRADNNDWVNERPAPTIVTSRRSKDGILVGRQLPEGEGENVGGHNWVEERPSTTVNGDPRISKPGRHDPEESGSQRKDAIRVTLEEALILQSFPSDYPVQGSKSKRFEQVGNAVPPLLAKAILSELLKSVLQEERESVMGEAV